VVEVCTFVVRIIVILFFSLSIQVHFFRLTVFKGRVSRVFFVSFDRSVVPTHQERVYLLLKFRFACRIFSIFASRRSELTL
jgi:hypothetical protein